MRTGAVWRRGMAALLVGGALAATLLHRSMLGSTLGLAFQPRASTPYTLPWDEGIAHRCSQGNQSWVTHRGEHSTAWDFLMWPGTQVRAARGGTIEEVERDRPDRPGLHPANLVRVRHADGTQAIYAHLRSTGMRVSEGQQVGRGQLLGEAGMSGRTSYPHLHFQVRDIDGEPLPSSFRDVGEPDGVPRLLRAYRAAGRRAAGRRAASPDDLVAESQ